MSRVPSEELLAVLGATMIERRPYEYATSSHLEELVVHYGNGERATMMLKDAHREMLMGTARDSKPLFLHEPNREVDTYRRLLAPAGFGLPLRASGHDWFVIDKAEGVELWQVGELEVWEEVARWLARFHAYFTGREDALRSSNPELIPHADLVDVWVRRARHALKDSTDSRAAALAGQLDAVADQLAHLAKLPPTLVHGEFYPSNVLVSVVRTDFENSVYVWPIDWEMATLGPGLLDLAALVGGWTGSEHDAIVAAYGDVDPADLDRCRVNLALQWIGWSRRWTAPPEHAHDWIGEALDTMERLT